MSTHEITIDYHDEPALLSRPLSPSRIRWELVAYVALVVLNLFTHLWALGFMAMHHDESVHAWMSWKFFTGQGGFECGLPGDNQRTFASYCYNPVYHGPTLYLGMFASFFLFGVSDATARLPMALAGVGLVASCWLLRPLIGRRAALFAAVYLSISPSILYFTRFARHDALILLWSLWLMVGIFRYLQERRARWLYLSAAALALAWATHELAFILMFILGSFLLLRLAAESLSPAAFRTSAGMVMLLLLPIMFRIISVIPAQVGGMAMLFFIAIGMSLVLSLRWEGDPIVSKALKELVHERRRTTLTALAIFAGVFALCFSVFFTYPPGIYDGLTAGLLYWLGQHGFRRGAQPWFYYMMQLPIYEPIVLLLTLGGIGSWIWSGLSHRQPAEEAQVAADDKDQTADHGFLSVARAEHSQDGAAAPAVERESIAHLFGGFALFWFVVAFATFSWAGEKMPWLVVHMTLPATVAGALVLDRMLRHLEWRTVREASGWLVVPAILFFLLALVSIAAVRIDHQAGGGIGRRILAFIIGIAAIYVLYWQSARLGMRTLFRIVAFTLLALLAIYTVRATALAVYRHPDTPRELLVYTQTGPDVPILARQIETIAKNQTRNQRSAQDPTGGHTMKVVLSSGDANGEGSLAWPFEWYLREFKNLIRLSNQELASATPETFQDAPVVLLYKPAVNDQTRQALEQAGYILVADTIFNWWFPEMGAGYKDRLYDPNYGCLPNPEGKDQGAYDCPLNGAISVLSWPLKPANWQTIQRFLLFRELPENARINGREMLVFMRCDIAPLPTSGCREGTSASAQVLKLVAEWQLATGDLVDPRGMTVGPDGRIYIADGPANRVVIIDVSGEITAIESAGDDSLNEPSGVAVDQQGNIYISNTWLARIDKFSPTGEHLGSWGEGATDFGGGRRATSTGGTREGNEAAPLGFFGPRGLAIDSEGNVYIADTGNKRIVVTDTDGNFRYQWGTAGAAPGQFNEPTSVAVGPDGRVYVADSWNGRVQVFERGIDGRIVPTPVMTIDIRGWAPNTYYDPALAVGPGGLLAVTVPERHEVRLFNREGQMLLAWGGQGADDASLDFPSGIAFSPDGLLYVAEKGNLRVSVFRPPRVR
ncbi:MAG: hypothetical protein KatS3mg057_2545 [Herpetosiphonaceae bacterium]|nr:MAG: hypothetical protein KatS3mg057_2545 [Herpetosiphonaceae bacterium]